MARVTFAARGLVACALSAGIGWFSCAAIRDSRPPMDQLVADAIRRIPWMEPRPTAVIWPPDPVGLDPMVEAWISYAPDRTLSVGGWTLRVTSDAPGEGEVVLRSWPIGTAGGGGSNTFRQQLVARPTSLAARIGSALLPVEPVRHAAGSS